MISVGFARVSKKRPCRICGKPTYCGFSRDEGTSICSDHRLYPSKTGDESVNQRQLSKAANEVTTDSGLTGLLAKAITHAEKARTLRHAEAYRELIEAALQRRRNAMAIWQDSVTEHGVEHSYQSVNRFVNKV